MKIFLKFFIFLVNQEANGYSCLLQCQGQKTENRVRENDQIFMVSRFSNFILESLSSSAHGAGCSYLSAHEMLL